jgi:hypothetical protein
MAQISDYTDYKTGTTSEEQSKLVETGKVVFSGKTTDNGDYETKSVALSELKSAGVPDIGTDTNRGRFLGVKENADELQWVPPLQIQNNDAPYGGYTSLIGNKSTIKLFSGLYYNKDSAGIGIKCDTNGGLVATKANGIGISTTNSHTGDVLTMTADGIVWAAPTATIDTTGAQEGYVLTYTNNTVGWSAPSGGGGGGQIVIDYDINHDTATYNGQSLTANAAVALCNENPNMSVNIFWIEDDYKEAIGVAQLTRIYPVQGLMFVMQHFDSSGTVAEYIVIKAIPDSSDGVWLHYTVNLAEPQEP